jgi:hypothetical protein
VSLCGVEPPSRLAPRLQRESPSEDEPQTQRPRNDESRSVSRAASIDFSMVLPP